MDRLPRQPARDRRRQLGRHLLAGQPYLNCPTLDGQVYGEPLEATGHVSVATENDTIYALAANAGAILWSSNVGTPVPSSSLPCGDISADGGHVTGTPVVNMASGEIFAVADVVNGTTPTHLLVGLDVYTGSVLVVDEEVDPPGPGLTSAILQRTGFNLSNGNVVFGYGGNDGDCSTYHGWIVSAPEGGGGVGYYNTTPNGTQGAVWMGGAAPEVDAAGNIWAATGNGSSSTPYDGSDSVIELSPALSQNQLFAPSTSAYEQFARSGPRLDRAGVALERNRAAGREVADGLPAEPRRISGASAASWRRCRRAVWSRRRRRRRRPRDRGVRPLWRRGRSRADQSARRPVGRRRRSTQNPIVAGGLVWSMGGARSTASIQSTAAPCSSCRSVVRRTTSRRPRWATASCWRPATDQVVAFSGSAGIPGPPSPAPPAPPNSSYWMVASDGGIFTFGNAGFFGSSRGAYPRTGRWWAWRRPRSDGTGTGWWPPTGAIFTLRRRGFPRLHGRQAAEQAHRGDGGRRRTGAGTG